MHTPRAWTGAVAGALLTAPLIALLHLGQRLAGLPFVPYDVFDWLARALPGGMVTFGIDTMVGIIRVLELEDTSEAAKTAERLMAISGLYVTGIVAGAALFAILRRRAAPAGHGPGLVLGALLGVPALVVSLAMREPSAARSVIGGLWILALFLAWGWSLAWVYRRLAAPVAATAGAAERRPGAEASGRAALRDAAPPAAVDRVDRRRFMIRLGGATAAITVAGAGVGRLVGSGGNRSYEPGALWSATHRLPNANAAVQPAPGTRPELTPLAEHYRIDINSTAPVIREEEWRLRVDGLVERPLALSLDDLRRYPPLHQFITLSCISNPVAGDLIGTTRWTGVSLQRLLPVFALQPGASHLLLRSADDFFETVPLATIRADERVMLAYAWDGVPLLAEHGFPLRVYVPNLYGMKQPKWITSLEALDHWEAGFWVRRGWSREAVVKATSVIDTVAADAAYAQDGRRLVPIGGIAFAGDRGISRVAVRVDDGPWQEARLRAPLSGVTWVLWRFDWPFEAGTHTFTVRCWDGDGTPQVAEETPVHPNGATGLHTVQRTL